MQILIVLFLVLYILITLQLFLRVSCLQPLQDVANNIVICLIFLFQHPLDEKVLQIQPQGCTADGWLDQQQEDDAADEGLNGEGVIIVGKSMKQRKQGIEEMQSCEL